MMEKEEKNRIKKEVITIFWVFIIGCVFGCISETILGMLVDKEIYLRKGLIYGPFIPVYGVGAVVYYFIVSNIKDMVKVFITSMIVGGTVEYICSYMQEILFGTISWDYSEFAFNLNGRTSLLHCTFWGVCGIFFVIIVYPCLIKFIENFTKIEFKYLTVIMLVFMIFNIFISCAARN